MLFVRNINYTGLQKRALILFIIFISRALMLFLFVSVPEEEIRKLFEQFGDIHKTFMMIPTRGIAFVTYVRNAQSFSPFFEDARTLSTRFKKK